MFEFSDDHIIFQSVAECELVTLVRNFSRPIQFGTYICVLNDGINSGVECLLRIQKVG